MPELIVIAECPVRPGTENRLRTVLEAMIEPSLNEPGCLAYLPYGDPNRLGHMVIVERWTGQEALEEHFATLHVRHIERLSCAQTRNAVLSGVTRTGQRSTDSPNDHRMATGLMIDCVVPAYLA